MNYYPSFSEVERLAGRCNLIPIYREILADLETPVSAFAKVARGQYSFLLESVEGGERLARYSFIGTEPYRVAEVPAGEDPLRVVEEHLGQLRVAHLAGLPRFTGGAVGYLAYETARHYERLPQPDVDRLGVPLAILMFVDTLLVFDHLKHRIRVVSHVHVNGDDLEAAYRRATDRIDALVHRLMTPEPAWRIVDQRNRTNRLPDPRPIAERMTTNFDQPAYEAAVRRAKEYIAAGDIIQVVPSRRISVPTGANAFSIYRALRAINPSPYMYYLELGDWEIVGASPEMLVRVEDGIVATHPIAGTRRRGADEAEDQALEEDLRSDEKERAEHVMLLDLGRNDIGRVSAPGTVRVERTMEVERYSHVMHLVSHVTGRLREDVTPYDALRACFPAGTVSGAPKIRAMEIIVELEPDRRGPYSGCVGYFDYAGNLDTAIAIRTLVVKDGVAHAQAGGGIVADSDPAFEFEETENKMRALLRAVAEAEANEEAADAAPYRQLR